MSESKHIVIIGGGVVGLCTALYASQRGHQVTLLERGDPEHDSCSLGNAGMIVPSHFVPLAAPGAVAMGLRWMWNPTSPFYIKPRLNTDLISWSWKFFRAANRRHVSRASPLLRDLSLASRASFVELAQTSQNEFGFVERGLLMLCKTDHTLNEEANNAETARRLGLEAQVLNPSEVARLDPGTRYDITGAVYFPKDCHLNPQRFVDSVTRRLPQIGCQLRYTSEVIGWKIQGDRVIALKTCVQEITGDEFVLAGGSWSSNIAQDLGYKLPLQAGKGYSLTLNNPRRLPTVCSICTESRIAVTPMNGSLRFGGTMEMAGLDQSITIERVRGIVNAVPTYFPDFVTEDFRDVPPWQGLRPCTPDGLPYLGRLTGLKNVSVATGHAMMGLSLAPITGKLMAEILSDEKPSIDITLLRPDRYG